MASTGGAADQQQRGEPPSGEGVGGGPGDPASDRVGRILRGLGYCGHYLHFHAGGQSGRAPMLCLLATYGGEMSQQQIASHFELRPGSLSEILAKIEADGLIERTRDPTDRRQLCVRLTEAGFAQARLDQRVRQSFRQEAFSCLSAREQRQLSGMLDRIRAHWRELDD